MTGQCKQEMIVHTGHYMADRRWANRYGWAVNHVLVLMLQIVSDETFKNSKHQLTSSDQQQHMTITLLVSYGNSIYF